MNVGFGEDYSKYYDLFYADKKYSNESLFVIDQFIEHGSTPLSSSTLVDLGCGSGRYLREMATKFDTLAGVDISPAMLSAARNVMKDYKNVTFHLGDIAIENNFEISADYVVSLFHVFSYMHNREQQLNFLRNIASLIKQRSGIGFFDFWNRKAWELDPPITRTRSIDLANGKLIRTSSPFVDMNVGLCEVQMEFTFIDGKSGATEAGKNEIHKMKAFFYEEIVELCNEAGLEILMVGPWMSSKPDDNFTDWYGYCVVKIAA
jgi:SAM-dependent methyltransferase